LELQKWRKKTKRRRNAINLLLAAVQEERGAAGNHIDDSMPFGARGRSSH